MKELGLKIHLSAIHSPKKLVEVYILLPFGNLPEDGPHGYLEVCIIFPANSQQNVADCQYHTKISSTIYSLFTPWSIGDPHSLSFIIVTFNAAQLISLQQGGKDEWKHL